MNPRFASLVTFSVVAMVSAAYGQQTRGIFTATPGDGLTKLVDTTGPFHSLSVQDIDNNGSVLFHAIRGDERGLFLADGTTISTVITTDHSSAGPVRIADEAAINDHSDVAFAANLGSGFGVYLTNACCGNDFPVTPIAVPDGPVSARGISKVSINNQRQVAFLGETDTSESVLYVGPDPIADKVISQGDLLFNSVVQGLSISNRAINDAGQIAFAASFGFRGPNVIVRADPQPPSLGGGYTFTKLADHEDEHGGNPQATINNSGEVAFNNLTSGGWESIFVGDGNSLRELVNGRDASIENFAVPVINDRGTVVIGTLDDGVHIADPLGQLTRIVDSPDFLAFGGELVILEPSTFVRINDNDVVAFTADFHPIPEPSTFVIALILGWLWLGCGKGTRATPMARTAV